LKPNEKKFSREITVLVCMTIFESECPSAESADADSDRSGSV